MGISRSKISVDAPQGRILVLAIHTLKESPPLRFKKWHWKRHLEKVPFLPFLEQLVHRQIVMIVTWHAKPVSVVSRPRSKSFCRRRMVVGSLLASRLQPARTSHRSTHELSGEALVPSRVMVKTNVGAARIRGRVEHTAVGVDLQHVRRSA